MVKGSSVVTPLWVVETVPSSDTVLVGITLEMPVTIISSLVTVPTGVLVPVVKYSLVEERVGV